LKDEVVRRAIPHIVNGEFKVNIDRVLDWSKVREGHEALEQSGTAGKIICTIG
jgi:NADPH:quinone reductase-like Zn-dependent oxidoreductase